MIILQSQCSKINFLSQTAHSDHDGDDAFDEGNFEEAIEVFTQQLKEDPENVHFLTRRCEAFIATKSFPSALEDAQKLVELDDKSSKSYNLAIECCLTLKNLEMAEGFVAEFQNHLPHDSSLDGLTNQLKRLRVEIILEDILRTFKEEKYKECIGLINKIDDVTLDLKLRKAKCLLSIENIDEAKIIVNEILKQEPANLEAAFIMASCFYFEGDLSVSIAACNAMIEANTDPKFDIKKLKEQNFKARKFLEHLERGQKLYKKRKYREAVQCFNKAIEVDKTNKLVTAVAYSNRGMALKQGKYHRSAIEDFNEAQKLNPGDKSVFEKRAPSLYGEKRYADCVNDCEEALKLHKSVTFEKLRYKAMKKFQTLNTGQSTSSFYKSFPQHDDIKVIYNVKAGTTVIEATDDLESIDDETKEQEVDQTTMTTRTYEEATTLQKS